MKAIWNDRVIAESDRTRVVEGNHYFPLDSVDSRYLEPSDRTSTCPRKGLARYYALNVDGERNPDAAWTYPEPKQAAAEIRDYIAFWKGVQIVD